MLPFLAGGQTTHTMSVYFESGSTNVHDTARIQIARLMKTLAGSDSLHIKLEGYCDATGSDDANLKLSERRLDAVHVFAMIYADPTAKYIKIPHGEHDPIASNDTEETRWQNRRVDIHVIAYSPKQTQGSDTTGKIILNTPEYTVSSGLSLEEAIMALEPGETLVLRDIQFPMSSDSLMRQSYALLDSLAAVLIDNPDLVVQFEGHICCTPDSDTIAGQKDAYNARTKKYTLSTDRALTVFMYLAFRGVPTSRMRYVGLAGSRKLVSPEETAYDQKRNRRVELKLLSK